MKTPINDVQIEPAGTALKVQGIVEGFYFDGAVVAFPTPGGGSIGIVTQLKGLNIGDPATIDATVLEAKRDQINVSFGGNAIAGQVAIVSRFRTTIRTATTP